MTDKVAPIVYAVGEKGSIGLESIKEFPTRDQAELYIGDNNDKVSEKTHTIFEVRHANPDYEAPHTYEPTKKNEQDSKKEA